MDPKGVLHGLRYPLRNTLGGCIQLDLLALKPSNNTSYGILANSLHICRQRAGGIKDVLRNRLKTRGILRAPCLRLDGCCQGGHHLHCVLGHCQLQALRRLV